MTGVVLSVLRVMPFESWPPSPMALLQLTLFQDVKNNDSLTAAMWVSESIVGFNNGILFTWNYCLLSQVGGWWWWWWSSINIYYVLHVYGELLKVGSSAFVSSWGEYWWWFFWTKWSVPLYKTWQFWELKHERWNLVYNGTLVGSLLKW